MHVIDFRSDSFFWVAGNSNDFAQSLSEKHPMTNRKFLFVAAAFATVLAMQLGAGARNHRGQRQVQRCQSRWHAQRRDLE